MKIFDHTNPTHIRILKEELKRAKRILNENDSRYSADMIWDKMTKNQRNTALYVAKAPNSDQLIAGNWDDIPEDLKDMIDLSDYELANMTKDGRTNIRGIESGLTNYPIGKTFVDRFLKKVERASLQDITNKQSYEIQAGFWTYVNSKMPGEKTQTSTLIGSPTEPSRDPFYKGGASWTGD